MDEELLDIVPESPRHPYDMYDVIERIVDDGEYFDIKPKWAKTIITCFARFGGRPVGIVANQPKQLAGILENDSADKAARFVNLCDAFNIPLVFLQDVPGFMVGTKVEQEGIIRHGAKMLYAVSRATVPKVTVVIRKAYGAGYYVMNGRAYEPDLVVAWPGAEISVMGAEGAVNIIFRKQIEAAEDPEATRKEMVDNFKEIIDPYIAAGNDMVDDIIDPRETRPRIIRGLEMAADQARRAAVEEARRDAGVTDRRRAASMRAQRGASGGATWTPLSRTVDASRRRLGAQPRLRLAGGGRLRGPRGDHAAVRADPRGLGVHATDAHEMHERRATARTWSAASCAPSTAPAENGDRGRRTSSASRSRDGLLVKGRMTIGPVSARLRRWLE